MQKFRTLVLIRLITFLMSSSIFGSLIWESSETSRSVDFSKLNVVAISVYLPKNNQRAFFQSEIEKALEGRAQLIFIKDVMKSLSDILSADLVVHFTYNTTDLPSIHLLQVYATTQIEVQGNQSTQNGVIWQKNYIFQDQNKSMEDLRPSLKQSLEIFINQYFANRGSKEPKPTYYFFFNP